MKVIIGLGNPNESYFGNRHNVGFAFCNYFVHEKNNGVALAKNSKLFAHVAELHIDQNKVLVCTPLTYMNESGVAIVKIVRFYKSSLSDLYIVHDDLDILLGAYKIQRGKGSRLHNGIKSIEEHLGSTDFWRIRIGVDNRKKESRIPGEVYVLQNFSAEESHILMHVFKMVREDIEETFLI